MKSLENISLYDISGDDYGIWISKNKEFGFNIEIENKDCEVFIEQAIHPMAAEGLADFCTRYLNAYNRVVK